MAQRYRSCPNTDYRQNWAGYNPPSLPTIHQSPCSAVRHNSKKRISELISNLFSTDTSVKTSIEFNQVLLFQLSEWDVPGINASGIFKRIYNIYSCCHQCGWKQTYSLWNTKRLDNFVVPREMECRFTFKWDTSRIKRTSQSKRLCRISLSPFLWSCDVQELK